MTWTLASFTVLFVALAAGFAWYERAHPSSRVLALVATLAALAALGRVAFAALPNVKPTTDIVLLSGYVLGGAPGFAVGAVAALASNLVFGEGPWTPWQMGAWGLCGLLGAGLARVSGRGLGRWPLAAACGLAGLGFGAILDFSTWTSYSTHTLAQYLVISGGSLTFNLAHAIGNVVFCLAFGPALVRALRRFELRSTVDWRPLPASGTAPLLAAALVAGAAALGAGAAPAPASASASAAVPVAASAARPSAAATASAPIASAAASRSATYLLRAQNRDGGWGAARRQRSSPLYSAWAAIGLASAGRRCPGRAPAYLAGTAVRLGDPGDLERAILALRACGRPARDARGRDLARALLARRHRDGSWAGLVNQTAFGIFALRSAGAGPRDRAVRAAGAFVARQQNLDGGFSFARRGAASGIDDTAGALQALVAAGRGRTRAARRALSYLTRRQRPDGGFPLNPGRASNAQSTAFAVQAFVAAGRNPDRVRRRGSRSALAYLRSLVGGDGSVRYSRTSAQTPVWVTAQALTALSRRPFPAAAHAAR
jgi:squalene-hopene cyclase-like protein/prenyltransferase/squalene oxidase-like repeat protein